MGGTSIRCQRVRRIETVAVTLKRKLKAKNRRTSVNLIFFESYHLKASIFRNALTFLIDKK